ncbi:PP2C family protein-serine/threonine phosphatase [Azospirillum agricola]|uniref:PP2C family protein-serine/threonine phosphatase n=1 Tax=Azospirillum agricola TaxID=1720247 RepID=UPI000A0F108F|nr:protein phosphatase 2C domain-containing protein [Azospirillum agricola]SMH62706.1 Protein phosphatase 2C [Azospirillum lipoferum]
MGIDFGCRSIVGARSNQEDSYVLRPLPECSTGAGGRLLAIVADGIGGHAHGALASRMAADAFDAAFQAGSEPVPVRLKAALHMANDRLASAITAKPELRGMGTTLVGACVEEQSLSWVSVGDSHLYLHRNGALNKLNADHSMSPFLRQAVEEGAAAATIVRTHPKRRALCSALTGQEIPLVDLVQRPIALQPDDTLILASDGLNTLGDDELHRVIAAWNGAAAEELAAALVAALEGKGVPHQDNATVLVARPQALSSKWTG